MFQNSVYHFKETLYESYGGGLSHAIDVDAKLYNTSLYPTVGVNVGIVKRWMINFEGSILGVGFNNRNEFKKGYFPSDERSMYVMTPNVQASISIGYKFKN